MKYRDVMLVLAALSEGALAAGALVAMPAVPAYAESGHHAHHAVKAEAYQRSVAAYRIPDVRLVGMDGKKISLREGLEGGEPVMLNFIFTSCTAICPVMSATFQDVQGMLGDEGGRVRMISISIDPENDTPARLRDYAEKFHAGPQWRMLTGSVADSIAVQRAFAAFRGDKMNHAPVTFLRAGGAGDVWVRLEGLASASDIVREYRNLAAR